MLTMLALDSIICPRREFHFEYHTHPLCMNKEQAEAELGQAQPKLRLMLKLEDFN